MGKYQESTHMLCDLFEDRIINGELTLPSQSFADVVLSLLPGLDWETGETFISRYVVADSVALLLIKLAREDYRFYDHCIEICVCNIGSESKLPDALKHFSIEVLKGQWPRPRSSGVERKKTWLHDAFLSRHVQFVADTYDLSLTRNDAAARISACDSVSEALTVCGCKTSYTFLKNLLKHPDKSRFRDELEAFEILRNDLKISMGTEDWLGSNFGTRLSSFTHSAEDRIKSSFKKHNR